MIFILPPLFKLHVSLQA